MGDNRMKNYNKNPVYLQPTKSEPKRARLAPNKIVITASEVEGGNGLWTFGVVVNGYTVLAARIENHPNEEKTRVLDDGSKNEGGVEVFKLPTDKAAEIATIIAARLTEGSKTVYKALHRDIVGPRHNQS